MRTSMDFGGFTKYRFGMIDAAWRSEIPAHWPVRAIAPRFLGDDTDRCPLLLDIHGVPEREQWDLCELMATQLTQRQDGICSLLLASDRKPEILLHHLSSRLALKLEENTLPKQFRFFDPGIFLQLPELLGAPGLKWLLAPIQSVLVPWAGEWTEIPAPEVSPLVQLTSRQHASLLRIGIVTRVAAAMPPPEDAERWRTLCARIQQHAERAQTLHRLTEQADAIAFCQHALTWHEQFDSHPRIAGIFSTLASASPDDELDYSGLTAQLTESDWRSIVCDLNSPAFPRGFMS